MDPVLSPLPNVPTEAERRAAVLRRDPRALALMLAPDAGLRATGQRLDESQLQRAVEGRQGLGAQFQQAMERGQEERQRVFGEQEMGLKGRQLGIEAGKLNLAQQQLEMGRWMPIQGADGITYLYDQKTHQIVNGIVPGQGWMAGGGQPGATVAPGQLGLGGGRPTALPAAPGAGTVGGPSPAGQPASAAAGPLPRPPQAQGLPPAARQFMELAARQKMPPEALKELDAGDKTRQAIMQGLAAVNARPQAFTAGQAIEEYAPGDYLKNFGRAIHSRTRDPADTQARAAVYSYTVGQMHDYFGARMTEPEFQRAGLFLPSVFETAENIKAKLMQALDAIDRRQARLRSVYMPALSMFSGSPGPAAGAPPAPGTTGAPGAPPMFSGSPGPAAGAPPAPGATGAPGAPGASPAPGAGTVRIPVTRNGQTRYWNGQGWED